MAQLTPRASGTVTGWNDERGFGFVTPSGGGERAFLHISAYLSAGRPADGEHVTYTPFTEASGRRQAKEVRADGKAAYVPEHGGGSSAGVGSLAPVVLLIAAYFVADQVWFLPAWLPWLYAIASVVTFVAYAIDKGQSRNGGQRVSENALLLLGLAGGWPGAIVAQLVFRHKTVKRSFRVPFWITVVLNVLAVVGIVYLTIV